MHATRGVLLPLTFSALLLALSLSSDVDIHGTKLIPNALCPNSGTRRPVMLSSCGRGASATSQHSLMCVCGPLRVCVFVRALSLALSFALSLTRSLK